MTDEPRQQAYLNLIQQLLDCPSGEEPGILQAHQELLDQDFVLMALAVAQQAQQQGEDTAARFLVNVATQVAAAIGMALPEMPETQDGAQMGQSGSLMERLLTFINADNWNESQRFLEQHPELLGEDADAALAQLMEQQDEDGAIRVLQEHRELLQRCRAVGIEAAFQEKLARLRTERISQTFGPLLEDVLGEGELTRFWKQLIRAEVESGGDEAAVHRVMRQKMELIVPELGRTIATWTEGVVAQNLEQTEAIAGLVENVSIRIQEFP